MSFLELNELSRLFFNEFKFYDIFYSNEYVDG